MNDVVVNPEWKNARYEECWLDKEGNQALSEDHPMRVWARRGNEIRDGKLIEIPAFIKKQTNEKTV